MALTLEVKNAEGKKVGSVDLPADIFDAQTNIPLIHQVVTAQLAAARQGTQKAKNRGETSGSGKKPFKQKGTGRARQGSVRAPLQRGGGAAHAVRPRDYAQRTPKKMIAAALRGVISDRQRNAYDILKSDDVVFSEAAIKDLLKIKTAGKSVKSVARESEVSA